MTGWPEFAVLDPPSEKKRQIVIVSNSQGYLVEPGSEHLLWARQLEALLNAADPPMQWSVRNWSLYGSTGGAQAILVARAVVEGADLIILATTANNFMSEGADKPDPMGIGDWMLLLREPAVRSLAPKGIEDVSPLPNRLRRSVHGTALVRLGKRLTGYLVPQRERPRLARCPPPETFREPDRPVDDCAHRWAQTGDQLISIAAATASAPDTRLLIVDEPLCLPRGPCPAHEALSGRVRELGLDRQFVSLQRSVACSHFYDGGHLQPSGHQRMARLLVPYVLGAFADDPGARR